MDNSKKHKNNPDKPYSKCCHAFLSKGKRCSRKCLLGSKYCRQHSLEFYG